jgi:ubiquitin
MSQQATYDDRSDDYNLSDDVSETDTPLTCQQVENGKAECVPITETNHETVTVIKQETCETNPTASNNECESGTKQETCETGTCCPESNTQTKSTPECETESCCNCCCNAGCSRNSGSSSDWGDIISSMMPILSPILMQYLTASINANSAKTTNAKNLKTLVEKFWSLCEGLEQKSPEIRAVCFMDRLSKFQEHLWSPETSQTVEGTAENLMRARIKAEIDNVMQLLITRK